MDPISLGLLTKWPALVIGGIALLIGVVLWLRRDAVSDHADEARGDALEEAEGHRWRIAVETRNALDRARRRLHRK